MKWSDIQHQSAAIGLLRRALANQRNHHAFLFDGPDGVGKELTARVLAARLMCAAAGRDADADPCGACDSCRLFLGGNHPDFHVLDREQRKHHPDRTVRASKGLFLGVDLVRHFLIEPSGRRPTHSARRVFLVREAERMNEEAQNALLKTLEEPPGASVLILVTSSAMRLLQTIRSRCQRIAFNLLPTAFVTAQVARRTSLAEADAATLARLAGGRLGAALRWQRIGLLDTYAAMARLLDPGVLDEPEGFGKNMIELAGGVTERLRATLRDPDGAAARGRAESGDNAGAPAAAGDDFQDEEDDDDGAEAGASASKSAKKIPTDELRDALKLLLALGAAIYRDALVSAGGAEMLRIAARQTARLSSTNLDDLDAGIRAFADAERLLDRNVAPQLTLERLAIQLRHGLTASVAG